MSDSSKGMREPLTADAGSRGPFFPQLGPRLWTTLALAGTLTCGDGRTEPVNRAPSPVGEIPDRVVEVDSAVVVDARPYFADPDGDSLTYAASSSTTATVVVAVAGSMVTVTGVAAGSATVTVTARDPDGLTAEQAFDVTVPNRAPAAVGAIADRSVYVDSTATVDVAKHFTDPDGDPLEYAAASSDTTRVTVAVSGSEVMHRGMTVGSTTVTVTATDPGGLAAEQVFEVTVPNRAPRTIDTIADREVGVDSVVVMDVAGYFSDPDRDPLAYSAASSDTTRATAEVSGSVLTVTGVASGGATVTVTARDPGGLSAAQVFGVVVPNRPPVPVGTISGREVHVGDTVTVDVEEYFTDPDGDALEYAAASSDTTRAAVSIEGSTVLVGGSGVGNAMVTVTAKDTAGLAAEQVFDVTVPNRAPVAVGAISDRKVEVDSVVKLDVARYFADPDGQALKYSAASSAPARATVAVAGSTMTLTGVAAGTATVTVRAADPGGLWAEQSFVLLVPNRPPEAVGTIAGREVHVGETEVVDVAGHFTDPDGDTLTYAVASSDAVTVSAAMSGSTMTVRGLAVGGATVVVTARDPEGLEAEQRVPVTVPNRAPEAVGTISDRVVQGDGSLTISVAGYFRDPDGEVLRYTAESSDTTRATVAVSGSALTLAGVAKGTVTVTVTARDPGGLAAGQHFRVTVPNRAPLAVDTIADREVHVGDTVVVDAAEHFADPDDDPLTYTATSSDTAGVAVAVSGSMVAFRGLSVGSATVTVTARDPEGLSAGQRFEVAVPNRAPEPVGAVADREIHVGDTVVVDVAGYFTEPDGEVLVYAAMSSSVATAAVDVSGSVLAVRGVSVGSVTMTATARDPDGLTAEQRFRVSVPNRPPETVGAIGNRWVEVDSIAELDVARYFREPDGQTLEYAAASSDTGTAAATVSGSTVTLRGVSAGRATVTVTARDPGGLSARQVFELTVPNRAPEPVGTIQDREVHADSAVEVDVAANFMDPDGDTLEYGVTSSDSSRVAVSISGSLVTVAGVVGGSAFVTVTASDPGGLSAEQRFLVTVPNRAPESVDEIGDQYVELDDSLFLDLHPYFTDPDGDELTYDATSSSSDTVAVELSGNTVALAGRAEGAATVTVTARDPGELSARQRFEVTVLGPNRAPYVAGEIEDVPDATPGEGYRAVLTNVFADPDGDELEYTASSSDDGVAEPEIAGDTIFVTAVDPGTATVSVTATDPGGLSATDEFEFTVIEARFDIGLGYTSDVTDTLRSLIGKTRDEWTSILYDTELNDVRVPDIIACLGIVARNVGEVDDHLVLMDVREVDGVGGTLAYAGYCYTRASDGSPIVSAVAFDVADVDTLLAYGSTEDVIFHEIAHGLGFISRYWRYKDLLNTGDDPHFEGELAIEAFDDAGGEDYDDEKVPISSPDHSHWRKSVFGREGMTPSLRLGARNPFSAITLQAMADIDYEVDVSLADDYELPGSSAPPPGPPGDSVRILDLSNDVARTAVVVLGRDGRIIRVIQPPPGPETHPFLLPEASRLREATMEDRLRPARPDGTVRIQVPGRRIMWRLVRIPSAHGQPGAGVPRP